MSDDTLYTISIIANDPLFTQRLNAGAAKEDVPGDPVAWVWNNRYDIAAAPGWAAAVDSWLVSNTPVEGQANNGWATDPAVITDLQILAQIQAMITAAVSP